MSWSADSQRRRRLVAERVLAAKEQEMTVYRTILPSGATYTVLKPAWAAGDVDPEESQS